MYIDCCPGYIELPPPSRSSGKRDYEVGLLTGKESPNKSPIKSAVVCYVGKVTLVAPDEFVESPNPRRSSREAFGMTLFTIIGWLVGTLPEVFLVSSPSSSS